ncbi:MAG: hypothetical protein AB7U20_14410, partial [Planctomycetaceae bacterium]
MVASTRLNLTDISRQKRLDAGLDGEDLTPRHTVGQVIDFFLKRTRIPGEGLRWSAFSRGVKLDGKQMLEGLPDADSDWMVMPEVSA